MVLIGLINCGYGYGAGLELNALADPSAPRIYPVKILDKRLSRGKYTSWYLRVEPWGPVSGSEEIKVSAARYRTTQPGDTVCIYLGAGALRIAWYQLNDCRDVGREAAGG